MAGVNPEAGRWKPYASVMETALDSGNGRSDNSLSDDRSVMHFSATRSVRVPSSRQNKGIPGPTKFTILYKGKMCIYEGIPAEKGNSTNLASPQSVCFPAKKSSIRRLQDEFPLARRQSLQRFLEKRRKRLANKSPYALREKVAHNIDNFFSIDDKPDFGSLNYQKRDFIPELLLQDN